MEGLLTILRAVHCRSTHHYFALDALRHIRTDGGVQLARMLLRYHHYYLAGAKDPDTRFRDFHNHVVHVADSHWGGAPRAAERWYGRLQQFLREQSWADAAHAAGVLSHYFTDPLQPLHTAQSEREAVVHRPLEWSICRSYDQIMARWQEDRFRIVFQLSTRADWLSSAVLRGAELAHRSYETLVGTYDLEAARRDPLLGLGEAARESLAELFGVAITGWARVLERTAEEATGHVPKMSLATSTLVAAVQIPRAWLVRRMEFSDEQRRVTELLGHYARTGRLDGHTPAEVTLIRKVLAVRESERRSAEATVDGPPQEGTAAGGQTTLRVAPPESAAAPASVQQPTIEEPEPALPSTSNPLPLVSRCDRDRALTLASSLQDAPSIGPKTAARFAAVGIANLSQFLGSSPEELARRVRVRWITVEQVADWQSQTRLIMALPWLRVRDAQLLVGVGCRTPRLLETARAEALYDQTSRYAQTPAGRRSLRNAPPPTLEELRAWIATARHSARIAG